jgi:hypothetical protein
MVVPACYHSIWKANAVDLSLRLAWGGGGDPVSINKTGVRVHLRQFFPKSLTSYSLNPPHLPGYHAFCGVLFLFLISGKHKEEKTKLPCVD